MSVEILRPDAYTSAALVSGIIAATGRPVYLHCDGQLVPCPTCSGTDPFCITCSGQQTIRETTTTEVIATVRWQSLEQKAYRPEGQFLDGDGVIVLTHSEELEDLMFRVNRITVDQRICTVHRWNLRGSPTNRIYIILREDVNTRGTRTS